MAIAPESRLILETAQLALRLGYEVIEQVAEALDDGKVSYWEGASMGVTFANLAMQLVPQVQQLVEGDVSMREIASGLRAIHDRLDAPDAPDIFGF